MTVKMLLKGTHEYDSPHAWPFRSGGIGAE